MVDFNRTSGNTRNRNNEENDEGYDSGSYIPVDNILGSAGKDYTKTYKGRPEVIKVEGVIIRETDSALLFKFQVNDECNVQTEWFPVSQVQSIHRNPGKKDEIVMSAWIATKKGIIS